MISFPHLFPLLFPVSDWICRLSFQAGDRAVSLALLFISEVSAEDAVVRIALFPFYTCVASQRGIKQGLQLRTV